MTWKIRYKKKTKYYGNFQKVKVNIWKSGF